MKKILPLLVLMIATFSAAHADNFVEKYKAVYPLGNKDESIVFTEDSIQKQIKGMQIQENKSASLEAMLKLSEDMAQMSMVLDADVNADKPDGLKKILEKYKKLASCDQEGVNSQIYADVKDEKIKEFIYIVTSKGVRKIHDMEFKKGIDMNSWQKEFGEISFRGKKIKDIISAAEKNN